MLQAKRRYKILLREQQRLAAKSQKDSQVDEQIAAIVAEFPELAETTIQVSDGAKAMLAFGESMAVPDGDGKGPSAAGSPSASAAPAATAAAPPGASADGGVATTGGPAPATQGKPRPDDPSTSTLERTFMVAAVVLRIANDLRARPTTTPLLLLCIVGMSLGTSAMHVTVLGDLCSWLALLTSPTVIAVGFHAIARQQRRRAERQQNGGEPKTVRKSSSVATAVLGLVERLAVFSARDLLPCILVAWVVYLMGIVLCTWAVGRPPRRYCFV
jgi:hypothetical protein